MIDFMYTGGMYEEKASNISAIHGVWRAHSDTTSRFSAPSTERWGIAFARHLDGSVGAILAGPSIHPVAMRYVVGELYWGIDLEAHVVIAGASKMAIRGALSVLPTHDSKVRIAAREYEIPEYSQLESFVQQLLSDGSLVADEMLHRALLGDEAGLSERSRQRKYIAGVGLTKKQVDQIVRARHAFVLLQSGVSLADAASQAGYADQAHMTRSFQMLHGESPARIIANHYKL